MTLREKLLDILEKYELPEVEVIMADKEELLEELLIALEEHGK